MWYTLAATSSQMKKVKNQNFQAKNAQCTENVKQGILGNVANFDFIGLKAHF